jgi:(p)ppGpp synthase/HD superfamily hydrolase
VTGYQIFDDTKVQQAIEFASTAHLGQFRRTGDPYVTHCIHTGKILAALVPSTGERVWFPSLFAFHEYMLHFLQA